MAPQFTEEQNQNKAREILREMSHYRIDSIKMKMTDTTPRKRGGQGIVTIGTLSLPAAVKDLISALKASAEKIKIPPEKLRDGLPLLKSEFELWRPVMDVAVEMVGMPVEALKEWLPEMKVAVKMLEWNRDDAEESTKFFKSFVHELSLMAKLSHPNIIQLVGFLEDMDKGDAWMVLPWEANGNVREFLQSGKWDLPERLSLIQDIAKGLEYLHGHQPPICHGDLKSLNILVNSSYHAVITDFGSARVRRNVASGERENQCCGAPVNDGIAVGGSSPQVKFNPSTSDLTLTGPGFSLRWIAPEVLCGEEQDLPSDLWAIGWICWEIITGRMPFEDLNTDGEIIVHTINGKLPAIREDIDLSHILLLCSLMSECWLLEPAKRINASAFQRKIRFMPYVTPSGNASEGQKTRSAGLLIELGRIDNLRGEKEKAASYYQAALDVATQTKNELAKGDALDCLAHIYHLQSKYLEAEQLLTEAQELHSRIGNDLGAAKALHGLGEIYRARSKHREAEKVFMDAHKIYFRIGSDLGVANVLHSLGQIYWDQSKYLEAEKALMEAHEIHSRIDSDQGAANALEGLGHVYRSQSKHLEAEQALIKAHGIHSRIGNLLGVANALNGLGQIYRSQSKYREAEKAFMEAQKVHSSIGHDKGVANALNGLGEIYRGQSKYREAEKAFIEAQKVQSSIGHDGSVANALFGQGTTYLAQSRNREAEMAFNNALKVSLAIDNHLITGNTSRSLGNLYQDQCRYEQAEASYRQALAAYDRDDEAASRARTLSALGTLYHAQGRYLDAEEAVAEGLAIWISLAHKEGQAAAYLLLAQIFESQSKHTKTMDALIQAEGVFARLGQDALPGQDAIHAETLGRLGDIHVKQGMYAEAEEYNRLAQAKFSSMGDARGEAGVLLGLGVLYVRQGRHEEAEKCLAQACVAYATVTDEHAETKALYKWMGVNVLQRKFGDAKMACMEACQIYAQRGQPMSKMCLHVWVLLQFLEGRPLWSLITSLSKS